jgi:hypothetical protein
MSGIFRNGWDIQIPVPRGIFYRQIKYFYAENFVKIEKRNGIAKKKWTKINVQF